MASKELRASRKARAQQFAKFRDRPLREFLVESYEHYWDCQRDNPKSPLFWFVWFVKGHADMTKYLERPNEALQIVEKHISQFRLAGRRRATPFGDGKSGDPWKEWFDIPAADARATFYDTWNKIRYRPGHGPLEQAFSANVRLRLLVHPDVRDGRPLARLEDRSTQDYEFFVGLAGHLQVAMGLRNIMLPCDDVAELMGISAMTVSRYRKWAIEDGYLRTVKQHRFKPGGGGRATEFRANPQLWEGLKDRITTGTTEPEMDADDWEQFYSPDPPGDASPSAVGIDRDEDGVEDEDVEDEDVDDD